MFAQEKRWYEQYSDACSAYKYYEIVKAQAIHEHEDLEKARCDARDVQL